MSLCTDVTFLYEKSYPTDEGVYSLTVMVQDGPLYETLELNQHDAHNLAFLNLTAVQRQAPYRLIRARAHAPFCGSIFQ